MSETVRPQLAGVQLGYLAGIIDGEGYIGLCKTDAKRHLLRVVVTSTSGELARWIESVTRLGKVNFRDMSHRKRQNNYEWRVFGADAGVFLSLVAPYLVVKRAQATIALRYQENSTLVGEARVAFAKQCCESLKLLNSRQAWRQNVGLPQAE